MDSRVGSSTLTLKNGLILGGVAAALVTAALILHGAMRPLTPREVLDKIEAVEDPSDLSSIRQYCSDQGFALLQWVAAQSKESEESGTLVYGDPKYSGHFCDLPAVIDDAEGRSLFHFRLIQEDGWKFHDIYLNEVEGKEVNLWASYMKAHPYMTAVRLHWQTMLESFVIGFRIGAGL